MKRTYTVSLMAQSTVVMSVEVDDSLTFPEIVQIAKNEAQLEDTHPVKFTGEYEIKDEDGNVLEHSISPNEEQLHS